MLVFNIIQSLQWNKKSENSCCCPKHLKISFLSEINFVSATLGFCLRLSNVEVAVIHSSIYVFVAQFLFNRNKQRTKNTTQNIFCHFNTFKLSRYLEGDLLWRSAVHRSTVVHMNLFKCDRWASIYIFGF